MDEHLDADALQRFRSGAMSPAATAAAAHHLATCSECARRGTELVSRAAAPGWLAHAVAGEAEHPDDETIVALAGDSLDGEQRRAVENHLRVCETCRREVAELRADAGAFHERSAAGTPVWRIAAIAAALVLAFVLFALLRKTYAPVDRTGQKVPPIDLRVERPAFLDDLRPRADVQRREGQHAGVETSMTPVGLVVESQTPQFAWTAEGRGYAVTVLEGSHVVERSGVLTAPRWTPSRPLRRGQIYEWQVEIHGATTRIIPAPPAPPAFFRVADADSLQRIEDARRGHPGDHLLLGAAYARAGMQRQAEQELSLYLAQHPGDAAALRLLQSIRRW